MKLFDKYLDKIWRKSVESSVKASFQKPCDNVFAARSISGVKEYDHGVVRIHNRHIKSDKNPNGIVERGEYVTVFDTRTEKFVLGIAKGAATMPSGSIGMNYDLRYLLGKPEDYDAGACLVIRPSTQKEILFYSLFQNPDHSIRLGTRMSKKQDVFAAVLFLVGLLMGTMTSLI